ncbi:hypothetical protein BD309DRAFT_449475 [Dichomitus squalens]|nr:hypothetical protein BD309DRAFT_449475 [Dichomitus squalens]
MFSIQYIGLVSTAFTFASSRVWNHLADACAAVPIDRDACTGVILQASVEVCMLCKRQSYEDASRNAPVAIRYCECYNG